MPDIASLFERLEKLEAENAELRRGLELNSQNSQAMRSAAVLKDFRGWAVHDDWAAYYCFSNAQHGACNAHLLRELQGLIEQGSGWAGEMRALLLELYQANRPLKELATEKYAGMELVAPFA